MRVKLQSWQKVLIQYDPKNIFFKNIFIWVFKIAELMLILNPLKKVYKSPYKRSY